MPDKRVVIAAFSVLAADANHGVAANIIIISCTPGKGGYVRVTPSVYNPADDARTNNIFIRINLVI